MHSSLLVSTCLALAILPALTFASESEDRVMLDGGFGMAAVNPQASLLNGGTVNDQNHP